MAYSAQSSDSAAAAYTQPMPRRVGPRKWIACWTRNDDSVVPMHSKKVTSGNYCAVIRRSCDIASDIVGNPKHCFGVAGHLVPAHRELHVVHPYLKHSPTKIVGSSLGIVGGVLGRAAAICLGPVNEKSTAAAQPPERGSLLRSLRAWSSDIKKKRTKIFKTRYRYSGNNRCKVLWVKQTIYKRL